MGTGSRRKVDWNLRVKTQWKCQHTEILCSKIPDNGMYSHLVRVFAFTQSIWARISSFRTLFCSAVAKIPETVEFHEHRCSQKHQNPQRHSYRRYTRTTDRKEVLPALFLPPGLFHGLWWLNFPFGLDLFSLRKAICVIVPSFTLPIAQWPCYMTYLSISVVPKLWDRTH